LIIVGGIEVDEVVGKTSPANIGNVTAAAVEDIASSTLTDAAGKEIGLVASLTETIG
jgi:hypothetical protein